MSKLWLLLVLVAAVQTAHSFPAEFEEDGYFLDDADSAKVEDYTDFFENDYEEDDDSVNEDDQDEERGLGKWASKQAGKAKNGLMEKGKGMVEKGKGLMEKGRGLAEKGKGWMEKAKKKIMKLKKKASKALKKGRKFLKSMGVKVELLKCQQKTCRVSVSWLNFSATAAMRYLRTNKATAVVTTFSVGENVIKEMRVNLGDIPNCFNTTGLIGPICVKAINGTAKTSDGKPKCNFCIPIVFQKYSVGFKVCATYENKKLRFRFAPKMFAGTVTSDGEMVEIGGDENSEGEGEVEGVLLDADEFEVDE